MNFKEELEQKVKIVDEIILKFSPSSIKNQELLSQSMNYSIKAGGKRIRPLLMHEIYALNNGKEEDIHYFMTALELIHTFSLIHDDLPAIDNDDYRRGKLTNHKIYGDAIAILAGDALLNYAYELISKLLVNTDQNNYTKIIKAFNILATKTGINGMIGGETCDVENEKNNSTLNKDQLMYIYENKTAALIQASLMIGGILAGLDENKINNLEQAGYNIGIAFQIQDDILDVIGNFEEIGKPVGSDEKNNKETYVTLYSLEESQEEVKRLSNEAIKLLDLEEDTFLYNLIKSLIYRKK